MDLQYPKVALKVFVHMSYVQRSVFTLTCCCRCNFTQVFAFSCAIIIVALDFQSYKWMAIEHF